MIVIIPGMHENDERVVIRPKSVSIMLLITLFFCNIIFLPLDIYYHSKCWGLKHFLCFERSLLCSLRLNLFDQK